MAIGEEALVAILRTDLLGRSPTEATRFDQYKSRLHLIYGESSSHRGRAGGRSAITN
jgi:hypothetical protein